MPLKVGVLCDTSAHGRRGDQGSRVHMAFLFEAMVCASSRQRQAPGDRSSETYVQRLSTAMDIAFRMLGFRHLPKRREDQSILVFYCSHSNTWNGYIPQRKLTASHASTPLAPLQALPNVSPLPSVLIK